MGQAISQAFSATCCAESGNEVPRSRKERQRSSAEDIGPDGYPDLKAPVRNRGAATPNRRGTGTPVPIIAPASPPVAERQEAIQKDDIWQDKFLMPMGEEEEAIKKEHVRDVFFIPKVRNLAVAAGADPAITSHGRMAFLQNKFRCPPMLGASRTLKA
ncbi:hypothetical protein T484DRAFT_1905619 [Baffinella frigidus]|nr:hypothetical protein T484DRAFT_1905619 [Cryptophyta sp. CCMP2293]